LIAERGTAVALPEHAIRFTPQQQNRIDRLMLRFADAPYAPPSIKEAQAEIGEDVYNALVDLGNLVPVSPEVIFRRQEYDHLVSWIGEFFSRSETLTVAQFRDTFQTSRRYALGFLEHIDSIGLTVRQGDARMLRSR
jgi:selenocysteine-specific elongation factor